MSFINKLLRKTEPLTPATGETAPLDERALEATPAVWQEVADGFQAATPAEQARADDPAPTAAGEAQALPPPPEQADESAWWEQAAPAVPAESEPAVTEIVAEPDTEAEPEQAPQITEQIGMEDGTRPLTAADVPMLAALRSHRGLAAGALRDVGRVRSANQDSLFSLITTLPRESGDLAMGLFIVADGMGGHHGGDIASRMAISTSHGRCWQNLSFQRWQMERPKPCSR